MSMTTVAQPTSNAERHCCLAWQFRIHSGTKSWPGQNLIFYVHRLAPQRDATENSKTPDFRRTAYSSLFQHIFFVGYA